MKIIIDGKEIETEEKKTILEVARENQIYIPSLCDHPRLTPFTGCRLCIVEIKGRKTFPPSCDTYVDEGIEIKTKTARIQKLRKQILELILSEHPNACLICSEKEDCDEYKSTIRKVGEITGCVLCSNNGRCELQEVVEALKIDKVNFPSLYRNLDIRKSDPFFDQNYNLCILCGRCVRVCQEVRGAATISFVYRGSQAVVGTVMDRPLLESGCQFCGACVDVCPTGALAERAIKYETLPEERGKTICALCSIGCELRIDLKKGRILGSHPVEDGAVNRGQACVKGRFTIRDLVSNSKRILKPLIKKKKELEEVGWEEALEYVAQRLKKYKGKEVGLIVSPQVTSEDGYLFYKFAKEVLKTKKIASASCFSPLTFYREMAKKNNLPLILNFKIEDISEAEILFLINENLPISHPIIWLEVLKAVRNGAKLIIAAPTEGFLNRFSSLFLRFKPGTEYYLLHFLSKFLLEGREHGDFSRIKGFASFENFLDKLDSSQAIGLTGIRAEDLKEASELLLEGKPSVFLFGAGLAQSPLGKQNLAAIWNLALQTEARLIPLGLENNLRGMSEIEKHFSGKSLSFRIIHQTFFSDDIKSLYLAGPMPYMGRTKPEFLVIQDCFMSDNVKLADVVFPATTFVETEGVFVNTEGRVQKAERITEPQGEAKPDWWIISQIAQRMGREDFYYKRSSDIMKEIRLTIPGFVKVSYSRLEKGREIFIQEEKKGEKKFVPPGVTPPPEKTSKKYPHLLLLDYNLDYYRNLALCEEIRGLKIIRDSRWIKISPEDAEELTLKEGEGIVVESSNGKCKGIVKISTVIPKGIVKANFLWSEDSDYSAASLLSSSPREPHSLGPIPVRIKKGK